MRSLTPKRLCEENAAYAGTGGVSRENRFGGFSPAFFDTESGFVQVVRFGDGAPAPMHLLDGLPDEWVKRRRASGQVVAVKDSVIAGFVRQGRFYTRQQAAEAMSALAAS